MSRKNPGKKKKGKGQNKTKAKGKGRSKRTAKTSDRHELYELSVQDTEAECEFIDQVWKERRKRLARHLREDFCGTAATSIEWVKLRKGNTAIGVDIEPSVLAWCKARLDDRLDKDQQARLTLKQDDVRTVRMPPVECVLAMNFSYFLFKTRHDMSKYFKHVRSSLAEDGMFLLDAYGGSESFEELEEPRKVKGFTYIWDQHAYNPITGDAVNYIHFHFPDGSKIKKAFKYDWRLWTLPELQELLTEAGFRKVTVYWEGTDEETEEGDGEFKPTTVGEACEGWIAYLVAEK